MGAAKETRCLLLKTAQRLLSHPPGAQEETRWRLLQAATEVFSEVGYHAATTREICRRAEVNLASIHYYYGDKAELYREVFRLPFLNECNVFATLDISQVSPEKALHAFYQWFFPPVAEEDPMLQLFMRLHAREEAEPSGVLGDAMVQAFRPNHEKMQALLCREFGLKKPDAEVDRLTFAVLGLATFYFHNRTALDYFAAHLIDGQKSRETMVERLVGYAGAMIDAERKRRAAAARVKK
ncbi:MAG TPA: CerR family C-terminal domain-containing protein [Gallionellaceae bacterium]|nr:CerR family C-terminal domain-containing protein [Gallionellaceae bacterium]